MARFVWTASALRALARLHKNPDAARRAIRAIRQSVTALAAHPEIGRRAEDMPPEFREWLTPLGDSGYVALYRYDGKEAVILAVRDARAAGY